jgi:heat shock protein beta
VAKDPRGNTLGRGTEITLILKEDAQDLLNQEKLEEIISHHSEFITFPIYLHKKTTEMVEVAAKSEDKEKKVGEDGLEVEEEDDEEEEAKPTTEKVEKWDYHRMNSNVAIWSREKDDITIEEYQKFYKVRCKRRLLHTTAADVTVAHNTLSVCSFSCR